MAANASSSAVLGAARLDCVAEGCPHLRALATIEEIAGFPHTARSYALAAAQCRSACCGAVRRSADGGDTTPPSAIPLEVRRDARPGDDGRSYREAALVRFDRAAAIDIIADRDGNSVERRLLKLETLPSRGDPLGYLYRYWCDLRAASAWEFTNIDTVHLERAGIIGHLHILDVSSSDPGEFHYELFAHAVPVPRCNLPRAAPVGIWADSLLRDYNTTRLLAVPRLHRIRCLLDGTRYHYTRLMLPFQNAYGRVHRLAIAIRQELGDGIKVDPGDQLGLAEVH
jgi:hypothetical protein